MAIKQFSNSASTTLANPISSTATNLGVVAGGGAQFPSLAAGKNFTATLVSAANQNIVEIVLVTGSPSADNFTIVRAQEGTTALSWSAGDYFNLQLTAGDAQAFAQADDLQAQAGNFGYDIGAANAYAVNLTPALAAPVVGLPIRVKVAHTNTGASTLNVNGLGAVAITLPSGAALDAGLLVAGGMYTFEYDGAKYQAVGLQVDVSGITQSIINLAFPVGAYVSWENDNLNPNTMFNWQQWVELQGVVLVGRQPSQAQFATTGQQGGEVAHQLVANECPPLPYKDHYYSEDLGLIQPGDQADNIGGINHSIGSNSTDYNNGAAWYLNATTQNGVSGPGGSTIAASHNNLQPYRVVRMWRRTA